MQFGAPLPKQVDLAWMEPIGVRKILELWGQETLGKDDGIRRFRDALPEELRSLFDDAVLSHVLPDTSTHDQQWFERELSEMVRTIEREWVKKNLASSRFDPQRFATLTKRLKELERPD